PSLHESHRRGLAHYLATGEGPVLGRRLEFTALRADGSEFPVELAIVPIPIEGRPIFTGFLRDITERKLAAEEKAKLAAIVESSDDAIISKDLSGIITSWNKSAERLFGYTADEAIGRSVTMLIPPDRPDEEPQILERLKRGERVDHFETIRVRKEGTLLDISLTISPVRDAEGRIVGASKIARDITERKRAEENARFLADASANLAMLVDHKSTLHKVAQLAVPFFADWCAVDLVDEEGRLERLAITHVDPGKIELAQELGRRYPPDPHAKAGPMHVLRTGRPEVMPEIPEELLAASARDEEHLHILRELGLKSYISVPLIVRGRIFGILTFVAAESGRTYGPADLAVAEDLSHRAAIAIENARLYSEAKEADRRKDEFLAMLAHELRNPLAPIRSGLDLLTMEGEQAEVVDLMRQQVDHMVRLVDDLLDLSRIMQGRIELRREPVEVSTIVNRAVEMTRALIEERGHHFAVAAPDEPIWVNVDAVRLAQVVTNLLNNAVKYTEPGGRISLSVQRSGPAVEVCVADTGIGIEPEFLPHVFDLFTQENRSLDRAQGGLGVGLTLVGDLVDLHGGTVEAFSEGSGRGSRFVVRLPVLAATGVSPPPSDGGPAESPLRRILVVDDTRAAAKMLSLLLSKLGPHKIEMAHDGPSALRLVEAHRPEIVFLDIGLPGMDGYEVARRLRDRPECAAALLVALTGYGQEEDRRRSRESGFDEHLVKPPALDDVAKMLVHPKLMQETREER
ncbi:MAG: PAS domain S-box protein, partial [Planctomycetaceae bacterium]